MSKSTMMPKVHTLSTALFLLALSFSFNGSDRINCKFWFCDYEFEQCPQTNCTCNSNGKFCQLETCKYPVTIYCPGYAESFTVSYSHAINRKLRIDIPCSPSLNLQRIIEDILPMARYKPPQEPEVLHLCIANTEIPNSFYENILLLAKDIRPFWYNKVIFWYKSIRGLSVQMTEEGITEKFLKIFTIIFSDVTHVEIINTKFDISVENISEFTSMKDLTLSNNNLKKLPASTFNSMTKLVSLKISLNKIKTIQEVLFSPLKNLNSLDLSNNHIKIIHSNAFKNNRKLKKINLSGNYIMFLPQKLFQGLRNLQTIHLQNNSIREFHSRTFRSQKSLWELSLYRNEISRLSHKSFHRLKQLLVLDLSYNEIGKIPPEIFKFNVKLFSLNLENNNLTDLPKDLFKYNRDLQILNLKHNYIRAEKMPKVAQLIK